MSEVEPAGSPERPRQGRIAGFWVRLVADGIDAFVLGAIGAALAAFLPGPLGALGQQGAFVGLAIALAYHGVLQSELGGGRTLGKRLLGLRVRRVDGRLLSLDRSVLRYGLLALLFYGGAVLAALLRYLPAPLARVAAPLGFGVLLALFVGCGVLVPFHPLKRGLHDLVADSIVVRGGMPPARRLAKKLRSTREQSLIVGAALLAVAAAGAGFVARRAMQPLAMLAPITEDASRLGVGGPSASVTTEWSPQGLRKAIHVEGFVRPSELRAHPRQLHDSIVAAVRARIDDPEIVAVRTTFGTGVRLGIYSSSFTIVEDATTTIAP